MVKTKKIKTVRKERYKLMYTVDVYNKQYIKMPGNASSGVGRPLPILSSKESLISLGQTINFIDNWLHFFGDNRDKIIIAYIQNMKKIF